MLLFAQTTTTTVPAANPARPITDFVIRVFNLPEASLTAGALGWIIEPLFQIVLAFVVAWVAIRLLRRLNRRVITRLKERPTPSAFGMGRDEGAIFSARRAQRMETLGTIFSSAIGLVVWTVVIVTILASTFGVNVGPLLAGAGIVGVALGFGAQDLVKDFLSGFFMLVEDQFGVGDVVDVGDATGVVEGLGLRSTRLRDVFGTLWHVPNGEIRRVGNMSQEWSRALLDIGVAYGSDIDQAAQVIKDVADTMAHEDAYQSLFLADPEIWGVQDLGPDSVDIRLVIQTKPGEQWAISRELRRRIKLAFDNAGIEIPFPQRSVWVREPEPEQEVPAQRDPSAPSPARGKAAAEEGATATADQSGDQSTEDESA
ncbi:MAG: mechanosensitive ion channel family protein [Acidimicrobiia bacterium]